MGAKLQGAAGQLSGECRGWRKGWGYFTNKCRQLTHFRIPKVTPLVCFLSSGIHLLGKKTMKAQVWYGNNRRKAPGGEPREPQGPWCGCRAQAGLAGAELRGISRLCPGWQSSHLRHPCSEHPELLFQNKALTHRWPELPHLKHSSFSHRLFGVLNATEHIENCRGIKNKRRL